MAELKYAELLQSCCNFNSRICAERRHRMPFLDPQTGVAQWASNLWRKSGDRRLPTLEGSSTLEELGRVVFRYPSKRWRVKPGSSVNLLALEVRRNLSQDASQREIFSHGSELSSDGAVIGSGALSSQFDRSNPSVVDLTQVAVDQTKNSLLDSKAEQATGDSNGRLATHFETQASYQWYNEASGEGLLDDSYMDDRLSDGDDYEEKVRRKKSKKSRTRRPKDSDIDKPHRCAICGARYKTKPGLQYHTSHQHVDAIDPALSSSSVPVTEVPTDCGNSHTPGGTPMTTTSEEGSAALKSSVVVSVGSEGNGSGVVCDFCLGDAQRNNKTLQAEPLVACKDCGRAGHPTCLQFTPNMVISTGRHGWQCIDCKTCAICGTSENDDQLLFCDDCDRGFHMYCLKPALLCAPEGNWSCHLCILEFGSLASNPAPP